MIVYRYGALKPKVLDGTFEGLLSYQRDSNAFYNALIEIERWRLAAKEITELLQHERLSDEQKTEQRLLYNEACRDAGAKTPIGWGQKQFVTERVAAAMKSRYQDEAKANQKAKEKNWPWLKRLFACPRPRFRRYDGEDGIAATLQGNDQFFVEQALAPVEVAAKAGTGRLKDCSASESIGNSHLSIRGTGKYRVVQLRLQKNLAIEVPIVYHREIPPGTQIIFARLMIDRIGNRWVYSVHFTLKIEGQSRIDRSAAHGRCAVNFGWRRVEGGVRVAYAVDDLGNELSLVFPQRLLDRRAHAESLKSLGDKMADAYLGESRSRHKERALILAEPTSTHRELGPLPFSLEQAAKQDPADREHWARRDRHLYQWERDEEASVLRARKEIYRQWARELSKKYTHVVIEAFDLRNVIERGPYELQIPAARYYRFLVGPSYLRSEVKSVFGEACELLEPAKRTLKCHACGKLCKWDKARELVHDCEHCGASWDQDSNNAKNQLSDAAE